MEILKPFQVLVVSDILKNYLFDQPFNRYFSELSKQHRNWGKRDRRIYKAASYAYFRMGFYNQDLSLNERIIRAYEAIQKPESISDANKIFPYEHLVSDRIDFQEWVFGHLYQRPVYLVIKKGCENKVYDFLEKHQIEYQILGNKGLKIPADSKCDPLIEEGLAWIMDIGSQKLADQVDITENESVWDACCGAGGKSLFINNKYDFKIDLTCSDKRFSILENLKLRFHQLGFGIPHIELSDLTDDFQLSGKFDKIILDVPCTGSGTWGRAAENILGFEASKLEFYSNLQKKIFRNVIKHLKPQGRLYYMTCSVFKAENEANIAYFVENHALKLHTSAYHYLGNGQSDYLFIAELSISY